MNSSGEFSHPEPPILSGLRILVAEDSWQIGTAVTDLLKEFVAEVSGPVATSVDALRLAFEQPPHAALVDFNLRAGELADRLIERLHERGIYVVVTTGYTVLPSVLRREVAILHKPISEAALLASLMPLVARTTLG
jgi:CheY-like chemotaxis protein